MDLDLPQDLSNLGVNAWGKYVQHRAPFQFLGQNNLQF
jgi:hypothetical protein